MREEEVLQRLVVLEKIEEVQRLERELMEDKEALRLEGEGK